MSTKNIVYEPSTSDEELEENAVADYESKYGKEEDTIGYKTMIAEQHQEVTRRQPQYLVWAFTLHETTGEWKWKPKLPIYAVGLVCQREITKEGGFHWQGAVLYQNKGVNFNTVKKSFPEECHIEPSIIYNHTDYVNTPMTKKNELAVAANLKYCTKVFNKDGSVARFDVEEEPTILGQFAYAAPLKAIDRIAQDIRDRKIVCARDVITEYGAAVWAHYHRQIDRLFGIYGAPTTIPYNMANYDEHRMDLSKSVVLMGPSGIGKTTFALAHFINPLLVSHIDDLKSLTPHHDGIVFDDMMFDHMPITAQIHLVDMEFTRSIHARFVTATIPMGTKRIFTCNVTRYPFSRDPEGAIERRVRIYQKDVLHFKASEEVCGVCGLLLFQDVSHKCDKKRTIHRLTSDEESSSEESDQTVELVEDKVLGETNVIRKKSKKE